MTDIDIDKLEALERAATPAPWLYDDGIEQDEHTQHRARRESVGPFGADAARTDDCIFLVELRNAAPALLAEVRRLRADLRTAVDLLDAVEQDQVQGELWCDARHAFLAALAAKETP